MSASFVRLFLVRHAEALANPDLRYLGSRDDPLTERGQWQALQLAHAFAPLDLAAVYTSPLTRAVTTARPIAEAHGLAILPEPRLVEAAMGTWEGLRRAEILARSADDAARHHQWEADPTCAPPGGESIAAVQARVFGLCAGPRRAACGSGGRARQSCWPHQSALMYRDGCAIDDGATAVFGQCHCECA